MAASEKEDCVPQSPDQMEARRRTLISRRTHLWDELEKLQALAVNDLHIPAHRLVPVRKDGNLSLADIWDLPEDQAVFADIAKGQTETVFQLSTPGATQWLRHFNHKRDDGKYALNSILGLAAFTALDRPGPLEAFVTDPETGEKHNMMVEYARRARGLDPVVSLKEWEDLFPDTLGICVFQEGLQRAYQQLMGCSGAEAEAFRGDVAKKKKEKVMAAYPNFMDKVGAKYGSEKAEQIWGLIDTWSNYGFNSSHAVCYVIIAYACAYLKHYYPLEWWTAVLGNATKEEINEKFWKYCGRYVNLPDVTKACANFEIIDDHIQAPLSLLHGVGEIAHRELLANAPYVDIADFVRKREAHKDAGTTRAMVPVMEIYKDANGDSKKRATGQMEEKVSRGKSALHDGIVGRLIVSGAMDSLFPAGTSTLQMLNGYVQAMWDYAQIGRKKQSKTGPKPSKSIKAYDNIDIMTRYQIRKQILPAYSEPVLKLLIASDHAAALHIQGAWRYSKVLYTSTQEYAGLQRSDPPKERPYRRAIAGYVETVRIFEFGEKDSSGRRLAPKSACELVLDFDGDKIKLARWPDYETNALDARFCKNLEGSLVVILVSKYKAGKPFRIDDIEVIQPALGEAKDVEASPEPDSL